MADDVKDGAQVPLAGQNPGELFDVVDDRDVVVGQATRREVHTRRLLHRAVHVLLVDGEGRVFLQQRSLLKDSFPGAWDSSCSGHLDAGEDYDDAAVRELREEIGVRLAAPPKRVLRIEASAETGREFVWVYAVRHDGSPLTLHPGELAGGGWFRPEEIDAWIAARPRELARAFTFLWPQVRPLLPTTVG